MLGKKNAFLAIFLAIVFSVTSFGGFYKIPVVAMNSETEEIIKEEVPETSAPEILTAELFSELAEDDIVLSYVDNKISISDEEFYGAYNNDTGEWTRTGYFDYEKYPEMYAVQEAAKAGNYALAKQEVLEYYRETYKYYTTPKPGAATRTGILSTYLLQNNFNYNTNSNYTLYDIFEFGKEYEYSTIDVAEYMPAAVSAADGQLSIYLVGLRKDGSSVTIESRNASGANPPVLEITSKGVTTSYYPTDDATISPSTNQNNSYGLQPDLLVEESVSSINSDILIDENTKRAFLKFDLSGVDASADITNARLKLYGKNIGGTDVAEVVAFRFPTNQWREETVKYYQGDAGEIEHAIFSNDGLPYLKYFESISSLRPRDGAYYFCSYRYPEELARFAWVGFYLRTYYSDKKENAMVAHDFFRQWIGYLNQYGNTPRWCKRPGTTGSLDGSVRAANVPPALMFMIDSEYMTPDLWSATLKHMWREARENLDDADQNNNWRTYQTKGLSSLIAYYKEFRIKDELLERATWLGESNIMGDVGSEGMIREDFSMREAAIGYALGGLADMLNFDVCLEYAGLDETILLPERHEAIHQAYRYVMHLVMPGTRDSQWGDSGRYTTTRKTAFESAGRRYNDPELLYLGTDGREGTKPEVLTVRYPVGKKYIMRTGWDDKSDMYLFTSAFGARESHRHQDENAIILYAFGQYLLTDQLFYSYSGSTIDLKTTRHHNTVEFNNRNQDLALERAGDEVRFETNRTYDNFTITAYGYNDVKHTRNTLFIKPGFWIINDYMEPSNQAVSNNYKQHWHMLPAANITLDEQELKGRSNFHGGANIQVAQADTEQMTADIVDGSMGGGTNMIFETQYLRFEKDAVGNTVFDTVLYPEKYGETANVQTKKLPLANVNNNGVTAMNILINRENSSTYIDADYYLVFDLEQKAERSFGNYRTDGRSAYVEKNKSGRIAKMIVQDATIVTDSSRIIPLFKSTAPVGEMSVEFNGSRATINSSQDIDLKTLTLYADTQTKITTVVFNGKEVPFKLAGRYIYFGDTPIESGGSFESETLPVSTPKPEKHGTGGVSGGSGGRNDVIVPPQPSAEPTPTPTPSGGLSEKYKAELEGHWGEQELMEMLEKSILQGDGNTLELNQTATRAQFVTMLVRALGVEERPYQNGFTDVDGDDWSAGYVQVALEEGIASGVGEGRFAPDEPITREQMAKMLVEAYEKREGKVTEDDEMPKFEDDGTISSWAVDFVYRARTLGLVMGYPGNEFLPQNTAQRDEAAVTIYRLLNLLKD